MAAQILTDIIGEGWKLIYANLISRVRFWTCANYSQPTQYSIYPFKSENHKSKNPKKWKDSKKPDSNYSPKPTNHHSESNHRDHTERSRNGHDRGSGATSNRGHNRHGIKSWHEVIKIGDEFGWHIIRALFCHLLTTFLFWKRNGHKHQNRNQSPKLRTNSPRGGHGHASHRTHSPKMNSRNPKYETYANSNHVMSTGQSNHTSNHVGQKYRQSEREHREEQNPSTRTNTEHDRVVFLKEEESSGNQQGNIQGHEDMNQLVLLDWNTPRNLNKGETLSATDQGPKWSVS